MDKGSYMGYKIKVAGERRIKRDAAGKEVRDAKGKAVWIAVAKDVLKISGQPKCLYCGSVAVKIMTGTDAHLEHDKLKSDCPGFDPDIPRIEPGQIFDW